MLPLQQAYEVKQSILEYFKATFNFKEKPVADAFYNFIEDPKEGLFKGPYVSLKLPFETTSNQISLEIKPNFPPYKHQYDAFERLHTTNGHQPLPTILTTGTGSGKTESFLFPILDYCYKQRKEAGIKVIILYPMNALATDQAKRLAEEICNHPKLKDHVRAGLFIGEGKNPKKYPKEMGPSNIIENRDEILSNPPDILLTNFKMLDYGLLRNKYNKLWNNNFKNPELLKFLVLDELHTYDGAQGTDVANLIRRLKLKLDVPKEHLCPIGTSATIGKGKDAVDLLVKYATDVFGEKFDEKSVITEHRLKADAFFTIPDSKLNPFLPKEIDLKKSRLQPNEDFDSYQKRQKQLWNINPAIKSYDLSQELLKLKIVKELCAVFEDHIASVEELIQKLAKVNADFAKLPAWDSVEGYNPRQRVVTSILALISEAKSDPKEKRPFLFVQVQLWIREMSGLLREFSEDPKFTWRDNVLGQGEVAALPPYFCRECGASGWLAVKHEKDSKFKDDPLAVYDHYFSNDKNLYLVNTHDLINHLAVDDYTGALITPYVDVYDLEHYESDAKGRVHTMAYRKIDPNDPKKELHQCPECNTLNTISIIGTRTATLNSIAVSQVLSSDLDPRVEKERKILEFSNAVQDAAHHAGFVEARNYRFTFRSSLQQVINKIGKPVDMLTLIDEFTKYWKNNSDPAGKDHLEAYYYRYFPSDKKGGAEVEDYKDPTTNKFSIAFEKEFDYRVSWELTSEFGYNAMIGRTLEKTGSSAVKFDQSNFDNLFEEMDDWMKANNMHNITRDEFKRFVNSLMHRVRIRGGVNHEYLSKYRTLDLRIESLNWRYDKSHYLNPYFAKKSRWPKPIASTKNVANILDSSFARVNNWFHSYATKSFPMSALTPPILNDFYTELFLRLELFGVLNKVTSKHGDNYVIDPSKILISNQVTTYSCTECTHQLHIESSDALIEDASCLGYRCAGHYKKDPKGKPNYYNLVYNRSHSPRIHAAEHTGLLDRVVRERTEHDFKERPNYNSINTLVATSTLEMGIDVGSLNSVVNTSVPPLVSNFLQRIGRAGRSSGTAIVLNFVKNQSHDLFYYEEPIEMMEGDIHTPGCFLNAKDILRRQFIAYCIDTWVKADPRKNKMPLKLKDLNLIVIALTDKSFFINVLMEFVVDDIKEMISRFRVAYHGQLDPNLIDNIKAEIVNGDLQRLIRQVFQDVKDELHFILNKQQEIDERIEKESLTPDEVIELENEKKAFKKFQKGIQNRMVLEHLTNTGILPNYAFPETGATLNAQVFGFKPEGGVREPETKILEIVRPSSNALKEFAPDNQFYSQGYKLEISGINTYDWGGERSSIDKFRFCSNCDHIERESLLDPKRITNCPKCDHHSWSSPNNVHDFAEMKSVRSAISRSKATLNDSKDERENQHYVISTHFKFKRDKVQGTYGMVKIPFGIEFVKEVELKKVNLGSGAQHPKHININKFEEVPKHGFATCVVCGKSTSRPGEVGTLKQDKTFHFGYCKHKLEDYKDKEDKVFKEVYLYNSIKTEAIKILLPTQQHFGEEVQQMFKAGLELGMRRYYKGNPDHIRFEFYQEFNRVNQNFDRYLVAYDTVPGGTGYLEKLFDPKEFTELLKVTYESIRDCKCKSQGKDGCYRCILSYGNQYSREGLSRQFAEGLFKKIVDSAKDWKTISGGVATLTESGNIEESELELRFIHSLKKYIERRKSNVGYHFEDRLNNGTKEYLFSLPIVDGKITYKIIPQYELGEVHGVALYTRTDFYIQCTGLEIGGETVTDPNVLMAYKSVALYLDGYIWHAHKDNIRFYDDLDKRREINETPNMQSWSLTWDDVELFSKDEGPGEKNENTLDELFNDSKKYKTVRADISKLPASRDVKDDLRASNNSIERLLWYLTRSNNSMNVTKELGLYFSSFQKEERKDRVIVSKESIVPLVVMQSEMKSEYLAQGSPDSLMQSDLTQANSLFKSRIYVKMGDLFPSYSLKEVKDLTEINKKEWQLFLRLFNLIDINPI
jgi:DEAD/DEAH box helicase domain-containing protein